MPQFDVTTVLEGYSKAMYSTWFYYGPDRSLFDAGEGLACRLENRAFAIRRVFLSHGHLDHISGIPTLVHIRESGMGEKTKALEVYYPEGDGYIQGLRTHLDRTMGRLTYPLTWTPVEPGQHIALTDEDEMTGRPHARWIEAFQTRHSRGRLTLGYKVMEQRMRLRPEYTGRPEAEIKALVAQRGREEVTEPYAHCLVAFLGDGTPIPAEPYSGADVLMHEATFLNEADREKHVHSTLDEAVGAAMDSGARNLVLFHVSSRYPRRQMRRSVLEGLERRGFDPADAWLVFERHWDRCDTLG
jgi:ribonuclease Z